MSLFTRRRFLHTGALAAAVLPLRTSRAAPLVASMREEFLGGTHNVVVDTMLDAALEAAKRAGATYTDVHVHVAQRERIGVVFGTNLLHNPSYELDVGFGVRALVDGYWGYAGMDGPMTTAFAERMGRDAALQARAAARGKPRVVELAPAPSVRGTWTMPIEIDPFTISYQEKCDVLSGITEDIGRLRNVSMSAIMRSRAMADGGTVEIAFTKDERTFASSEGSRTNQTTYDTSADLQVSVPSDWSTELAFTRSTGLYSIAGAGWEYLRAAPFRELAPRMIAEALAARRPKHVDMGRYDIVFDAQAMAGMLDRTIGPATALDRAMGDMVNDGTSFLDDPLAMLGVYRVGSEHLTVTTDRAMPGGAATVQWDDEGVVPTATALVTNGILTDYQTTRESASWLASYYQTSHRPIHSNGCACALGTQPLAQRLPNLIMAPGRETLSFDDLVKSTSSGLAVFGGSGRSDYQWLNGTGTGELIVEIKQGRLGQRVDGATYDYRAPEFWRNLVAVGGAESAHAYGFERRIPGRVTHTIVAVPGKVTNVSIIDARRRA